MKNPLFVDDVLSIYDEYAIPIFLPNAKFPTDWEFLKSTSPSTVVVILFVTSITNSFPWLFTPPCAKDINKYSSLSIFVNSMFHPQ